MKEINLNRSYISLNRGCYIRKVEGNSVHIVLDGKDYCICGINKFFVKDGDVLSGGKYIGISTFGVITTDIPIEYFNYIDIKTNKRICSISKRRERFIRGFKKNIYE